MLGLPIFRLGSCSWFCPKGSTSPCARAGSAHLLGLLRFESPSLNVFAVKFSYKKKPGKIQVWCEGRLWSPSFRSRWKAFFLLSASDSKHCRKDSEGIGDSDAPWFSNAIYMQHEPLLNKTRCIRKQRPLLNLYPALPSVGSGGCPSQLF